MDGSGEISSSELQVDAECLALLQSMEKTGGAPAAATEAQEYIDMVTGGHQRYASSSLLFSPSFCPPDSETVGCLTVGGDNRTHKGTPSYGWEDSPPFGKVCTPSKVYTSHGFPSYMPHRIYKDSERRVDQLHPTPSACSPLCSFTRNHSGTRVASNTGNRPLLLTRGILTYPSPSNKRVREEEAEGDTPTAGENHPLAKKARRDNTPALKPKGQENKTASTKEKAAGNSSGPKKKSTPTEKGAPTPSSAKKKGGSKTIPPTAAKGMVVEDEEQPEEIDIGSLPDIPEVPQTDTVEPPRIPQREPVWTLKFIAVGEVTVIKKKINDILLPTKGVTGYYLGMLDKVYLKDPISNVWHWDIPKSSATNRIVFKIFCSEALRSPLGNNKGIFAMNGIKSETGSTSGTHAGEASEEVYRRQPLLMTGPMNKQSMEALPKWLADLYEPGRENRAHPRAQLVGVIEGPSQIKWAVVETYSPQTHAFLAKGEGGAFSVDTPGAPPPFRGVPWCKAPNSVVIQNGGFGGLSQPQLQEWVTSVAELVKAPVPVSVVGLTSPHTGWALNGAVLVFDTAANRLPWAPSTNKEEGCGQVEKILALTKPTATTVHDTWGKPPAKGGDIVIKSLFPHVTNTKVKRTTPIDPYATPNGTPKQYRQRGNKKRAKQTKAGSKGANKEFAHKRIAEKKEKEEKAAATKRAANAKKPVRGGKNGARK